MAKTNLYNYQEYLKKKKVVILILVLINIVFFIGNLFNGATSIGFLNTVKALFFQGNESNIRIIWLIRMPRILAGILAGASLAMSGLVMQTLLQNKMASPTTLGVNNGAVFGANLAIIVLGVGTISNTTNLSIHLDNPYVTTILAFVFAMVAVLLILGLSTRHHLVTSVIVLAGVALGAFFNALTTILQYFAEDTALSTAIFWSFGDLSYATYLEDLILFVVFIFAFVYFLLNHKAYNALMSGDDLALSLGINVKRLRITGLIIASLLCAISVSFLGIIGFVGLIAPHIATKLVGTNHKYHLITTILIGILILLCGDLISRLLIKGAILPIGAITSLLGAPLFIILALKKRGEYHDQN